MKRGPVCCAGLALGVLAGFSASAGATTEPPTVHAARAMAMGSTAVAHVHNGASIYHNVATLHEVHTLVLTADLALVHVGQSAPVEGPNTSLSSEAAIVPQFLVGGAYRLSHNLVVGAAAYTTAGFGAEYKTSAPGFSKLELGALEVSPAAEFSITPQFAIGAGYRITHVMQKGTINIPLGPTGPIAQGTSDLSGTSFKGFDVGVYFRPMPALKLGLAYRSKTTTTLKGNTTVMGMSQDTSSDFAFPHGIKLGLAYEAIENKLLLALDTRYLFHSEANKQIATTTGGMTQTAQLDWKNSFSVGAGLEYFVTESVPVRAGYMVSTSATPDQKPAPFFPPPGLLHSVHGGAGLRLSALELDAALYYAFGSHNSANPDNGFFPGKYTMGTLAAGLSATYRQ